MTKIDYIVLFYIIQVANLSIFGTSSFHYNAIEGEFVDSRPMDAYRNYHANLKNIYIYIICF